MQQHQPGMGQHNPNVPYYDQSMNLMNTGISSGQGGYNDGVYHDAPNRYDRIYIFSRKFNTENLLNQMIVLKLLNRSFLLSSTYFIKNVLIDVVYRINIYS